GRPRPSRVATRPPTGQLHDKGPVTCLSAGHGPFVPCGGARIRTWEGEAGRFTVCSLWPLGHTARVCCRETRCGAVLCGNDVNHTRWLGVVRHSIPKRWILAGWLGL